MMISYSEVFWRTRCSRGGWSYHIFECCQQNSYASSSEQVGSMMCSISNETCYLLDGQCKWTRGWSQGAKGVHIEGTRVERLVCYLLEIEQPPLRKYENSIPALADLMDEVKKQKELFSLGKLKRPSSSTDLGLSRSLSVSVPISRNRSK